MINSQNFLHSQTRKQTLEDAFEFQIIFSGNAFSFFLSMRVNSLYDLDVAILMLTTTGQVWLTYAFYLYYESVFQDLQVKSIPPAQKEDQIHDDPAIIQVLTF